MKRPASQYYWGDWRRDTALQSCSLAARGLWHEMNCLMHDCEPYGHLMVGASPMQPAQLARLVGVAAKECAALLAELESAQVFSRRESDGAIYSRRMVRDEDLRERRAAGGQAGAEHGAKGAKHGGKGGRPSAGKGGFETPLKPDKKPPPASASASAVLPPARTNADDGGEARASPTAAGAVCLALRAAGITSVNPSHPDLLALLDAGATEAELLAIVPSALGKGDPFAWLLVAAANRRRDAAQRAKVMHTGPLPPAPTPTEPAWRTEQRAATTALAGRYAAKPATAPAAPAAAEVIDATPRLVG